MATFLQLAQGVALESGTFSGTNPSSVASQTGRLAKVVSWTAEAWTMIQNLHSSWRWMEAEFPATALTVSGTARYLPSAWSITDHAQWLTRRGTVSMYLNATGVSDEGDLVYMPDWDEWYSVFAKGSQTNARPTYYSISPSNQLCLGPAPDAVYRLNGLYRTTPQVLSANADEPNCPARFHDIIKWRAVLLLGEHDEATPMAVVTAQAKYREYLGNLERDQLPRIRITAAPIA